MTSRNRRQRALSNQAMVEEFINRKYAESNLQTPVPSEAPKKELPVYKQEEAIRAWKVGQLSLTSRGNSVYVAPMYSNHGRHEVEAFAECMNGGAYHLKTPNPSDYIFRTHTLDNIPHPDCTCGFYAVGSRAELRSLENVVLEVDLSGRVMEHEKGYRAAHQRILRVILNYGPCGGWLCNKDPEYLSFESIDTDSGTHHQLTHTRALPWCSEHVTGNKVATAGQLANVLGMEVEWGWAERARLQVPSPNALAGGD